jgi:hypothetical protein
LDLDWEWEGGGVWKPMPLMYFCCHWERFLIGQLDCVSQEETHQTSILQPDSLLAVTQVATHGSSFLCNWQGTWPASPSCCCHPSPLWSQFCSPAAGFRNLLWTSHPSVALWWDTQPSSCMLTPTDTKAPLSPPGRNRFFFWRTSGQVHTLSLWVFKIQVHFSGWKIDHWIHPTISMKTSHLLKATVQCRFLLMKTGQLLGDGMFHDGHVDILHWMIKNYVSLMIHSTWGINQMRNYVLQAWVLYYHRVLYWIFQNWAQTQGPIVGWFEMCIAQLAIRKN